MVGVGEQAVVVVEYPIIMPPELKGALYGGRPNVKKPSRGDRSTLAVAAAAVGSDAGKAVFLRVKWAL